VRDTESCEVKMIVGQVPERRTGYWTAVFYEVRGLANSDSYISNCESQKRAVKVPLRLEIIHTKWKKRVSAMRIVI
jgi:hypothetical protein